MERQPRFVSITRKIQLTPEYQALQEAEERKKHRQLGRSGPLVVPPAPSLSFGAEAQVRPTLPLPTRPPVPSFTNGDTSGSFRGTNGAVPRLVPETTATAKATTTSSSLYGYSRPLPKPRLTATEAIDIDTRPRVDSRYVPAASRHALVTEDDPELYQYDELAYIFSKTDLEIQRAKSQGLRVARRVITEPVTKPRRHLDVGISSGIDEVTKATDEVTKATEALALGNLLIPSSMEDVESRRGSVIHLPTKDGKETENPKDANLEPNATMDETKLKVTEPDNGKSDDFQPQVATSETTEPKGARLEATKPELTTKEMATPPSLQSSSGVAREPTKQSPDNTPEPPKASSSTLSLVKLEPFISDLKMVESLSKNNSNTNDYAPVDTTNDNVVNFSGDKVGSTSVVVTQRRSRITRAGLMVVAAAMTVYLARLGYNGIDFLVWLWQYRSWFNIPWV